MPDTILDDAVFDDMYHSAVNGDLKIFIACGAFVTFTKPFRSQSGSEMYGLKGLMATAKALVRQESLAAIRIAKLLTALSRTGAFVFIQITTGINGFDWTELDEFRDWITDVSTQPVLHGARSLFQRLRYSTPVCSSTLTTETHRLRDLHLVPRPAEEDERSRTLLALASRLIAAAVSISPPTEFNVRDPFPLDEHAISEEVTFSTPLNRGTVHRKVNDIANESVIGGLREARKSIQNNSITQDFGQRLGSKILSLIQ